MNLGVAPASSSSARLFPGLIPNQIANRGDCEVDVPAEVDRHFDDSSRSNDDEPIAVVISGGIAAGKTTLRKQKYATGYVLVDAVDIFLSLSRGECFDFPEAFQQPMDLIGRLVAQRAVAERRNIVTEIVGALSASPSFSSSMHCTGSATGSRVRSSPATSRRSCDATPRALTTTYPPSMLSPSSEPGSSTPVVTSRLPTGGRPSQRHRPDTPQEPQHRRLIDDRATHGVAEFCGEHIHFGSEIYPDWPKVMAYLQTKV